MTPTQLKQYATAIYGNQFQRELARDLNVNVRSVKYWLVGRYKISDRLYLELAEIAERRSAEILKLAKTLKKLAPKE